MPKRRYSMEIIGAVLEAAQEGPGLLKTILERHGIPERTYHHWRRKYPLSIPELLRHIRELQTQVRELQRIVRREAREARLLREMLGKPWRRLRPGAQPSDGQPEGLE